MRLPNGDRAFIDMRKITDYALNPQHKEGAHKSRVFAAALGLRRQDADWLRERVLAAAEGNEAARGITDEHGTRYTVDFDAEFGAKRTRLRAAWNVRPGEDFPRLTSLYVVRARP